MATSTPQLRRGRIIDKVWMLIPGISKSHTLFALTSLVFMAVSAGSLRAQSLDYVYGIENTSNWELDQLVINYNAGTYTQQSLVSLSSLIPGYNTNTQMNGVVNGLAMDPSTRTLYFTYSYNNRSSSTAGTFTATTYALRSTSPTTWSITQIYTVNVAAGTADAPGANNTAAKPGAINTASGWFSRAGIYNGSYYAGIQGENSLFQINLSNGQTSVYSNINHGGTSAIYGGDLVFDANGNMYISGDPNTNGTNHTIAEESLANAKSASGTAWNATNVTDYYQLGGLGGSPRLYSAQGADPYGLYSVTNFANPSGTTPTFTELTLTSGVAVQYSDLSDAVLGGSIVVPEATTLGAGILGGALTVGACIRRGRKRRESQSGC